MNGTSAAPPLNSSSSTSNGGSAHTFSRENENTRTTVLFSVAEKVGALDDVLAKLRDLSVTLTRIESRPSRTNEWDYDFFIDFDASSDTINTVVAKITEVAKEVRVVNQTKEIPWFPRKVSDLDEFAHKVLECGAELSSDHPGFTDAEYRKRRDEITMIARSYRHGQPIPRIEYTEEENHTWSVVYEKLTKLFPTHACRQVMYVFPLLEKNCGYGPKEIPQLEPISNFLKDCTGFTLRPVMGLLTARDFLNGLAFRVFHSTQYIRHHSKPLYTPEPDVCHELLGHVPLFADPSFADFSQEIGLASIGASDDDIEKLATIYWFTVEFGICKQGDELRAYGAGLLSSFGELEYCLTDKNEKHPFDPSKAAVQKYPITEYQPVYFVADSFSKATELVRNYANSMSRPFSVRYNAYTQSIEVLDKRDKILRFATSIRQEMDILTNAISLME